MFPRKILAFLLIAFLLAAGAEAASTFPYANITLTLPGLDEPYQGLGTNYSSLGSGIRTVLWNPAGLAKIKVSEAYFGATSAAPSLNSTKSYNVKDSTFEVTGTGTTSASGFTNKILFTDNITAIDVATRDYSASIVYAPSSSGLDYKQAIKVSDWLALGISSRGNTGSSINIQGSFPSQWISQINLYNTQGFMGSGISVTPTGKFSYTYTPTGGSAYTYTSEASVYSGFLEQTQRVPLSAQSESHDNFDVQSNLTFTGAAKWNRLSAGLNVTPVSASMNVNNTVKVIVKEGASDPYFYTPTFDPNNEADVLQWINDPTRYGTEAGFTKRYIRVPAGESIAEAKYAGFYQAAAIRSDFGLMYDLGDFVTVGAALENMSGANLNFKGAGRVAYVNTRINTAESPGSLLDPATTTIWNPFTDTFAPMQGTENIGMLPEINIPLPQKTRIGFTLRKPILITFDYETQNSPIKLRINDSKGNPTDVVLSNIRFLRGGLESQVFSFPMWIRGSFSLLWKPDASGLDAASLVNYNKAFLLVNRLMPLSLDLGMGFNLWGYMIDTSGGLDGSTVFSLMQADTLNSGFSKILYYNLGIKKDNWRILLQNNLDTIATGTAYMNRTNEERASGEILKFIKWFSTLTVGFDF